MKIFNLSDYTEEETINLLNSVFEFHGTDFRVSEYKLRHYKFEVTCANLNHTPFSINPDSLLRGRWCLKCGNENNRKNIKVEYRKNKILKIKNLISKFGQLKSDIPSADNGHIIEICCSSCNHEFKLKIGNIIGGKQCPKCRNRIIFQRKLDYLNQIKKEAALKQGECKTLIYSQDTDEAEWFCNIHKHSWKSTFELFRKGVWCSKCAYDALSQNMLENTPASSIEELEKKASENQGYLLYSGSYKGLKFKYEWKCNYDHIWETAAENVLNGSWCPECSSGLYERICRVALETIFDKKFPKIRPKWLINPKTGKHLELDGYCEELCIAFEHQGPHHYEAITFGGVKEEKLLEIQARDQIKKELCESNNTKLIIIPCLDVKLPIKEIKSFIKNDCVRLGIQLPLNIDTVSLDLALARIPYFISEYQKLQKLAIDQNGKLLSPTYLGNLEELEWWCDIHQISFFNIPKRIKLGVWCPECAGFTNWTIGKCENLAFEKNGGCLSTEFIKTAEYLTWKCEIFDHPPWRAPISRITQGHWCPACKAVNMGIRTKLRAANKRNGIVNA